FAAFVGDVEEIARHRQNPTEPAAFHNSQCEGPLREIGPDWISAVISSFLRMLSCPQRIRGELASRTLFWINHPPNKRDA
ncbi:hypothetical protein, partial [Bradyrhizobium japonicum]|uniref:hypothetical protein n=1 Tax=Bradyrhizobium japonicum TaxID=375 RepID=UPI001AEFF416